jgi:RNA polymerase sigma factor (sigma-70 family)
MTELARHIRKKDEQAITLLYNSYGKKLYGFAIRRWNLDEDEAWELVYKTLYKVMEVIDKYSFETESKFNGFIFRIFINNLKNHYQAKKSRQVQTVELEEKHGSILPGEKDNVADCKESLQMKCLKSILAGFDDWKRVLLLMKAQNFSYEDIARYVNKPAEQLKVYYMRAKQVLVEKVNECVSNS